MLLTILKIHSSFCLILKEEREKLFKNRSVKMNRVNESVVTIEKEKILDLICKMN